MTARQPDTRGEGGHDPAGRFAVGDVIADLRAARGAWRTRQDEARDVASFPSRAALEQVVARLSAALYPRRLGHFHGLAAAEDGFVVAKLLAALTDLEREIGHELGYWQREAGPFDADQAATIVRLFSATLGDIRRLVDSDVEAAFLGDPAARSVDEILVCYPGAIASLHHRIAHELHELGAPIVARLISELANERTGIDIHPGATIGERFFIDHGTGVVIGETAIIGDRVRLYQGVTLGGDPDLFDDKTGVPRHPIIEDDVVIHANASIVGRVTVGARSIVAGNLWLRQDVPPGTRVEAPRATFTPVATRQDTVR